MNSDQPAQPQRPAQAQRQAAQGQAQPQRKSAPRKPAPGQKDTNPNDIGGLGAVVLRNEFYRDGYRSMLRLNVMQGAVILLLVVALFYIVNVNKKEYQYFATTEDGRLVPMVPLSQPNLSTPALLSWAAQASSEVMTFGFNDYRRRLQESSRYFTPVGWSSFTQALERAGIISSVEQNQQVLSAVPGGAPVLLREGVRNGQYFWQIQMPLVVTYQSGARSRTDRLTITLIVVRVPRLESPNGVGIEQWLAS